MVWARTGGDLTPPAAGTAVDLLETFRADGGSTIGATVTRTRLSLALNWNQLRAGETVTRLVMGVLVDQRDQPEAQVPRPAVELHADWMHWAPYPAVSSGSLAWPTLGEDVTNTATSLTIDIKSQRKCEELGDTLWAVFDPTFPGGTPVTELNISWSASVLLKLP